MIFLKTGELFFIIHTAWDGLSQAVRVESEGCAQIASNCSSHRPQPSPPTNYPENFKQTSLQFFFLLQSQVQGKKANIIFS